MSSNESGAVGRCENGGPMKIPSDFLQLEKFLQDNLSKMEERFQTIETRFVKIEECLSQEQGRTSKLEESVARAVDGVMPKVEELLARHLSPQPSREAAPHVAPSGASAAPRSSTANVASPAAAPQPDPQQGQGAVGGGNPPRATASASAKPTEGALVADGGGRAPVAPAQSPKGASPASGPSAPPPSEASAATNPPASLHEAAERGDAAAVQRCLAHGARVDARDEIGNTALHIAASSGHAEVVDILIAKGSAVNKYGYRARTPLHCAAAQGHEAIVARLVTAGAEVDSPDADGATAAALAAQGGHAEVVHCLLDQGMPVEAADNKNRTLLMYAAEGENLQIIAHLLEQGASPLNMDKNSEFPLLLGSKKGNGDMVGEMLKVATAGDIEHLKRCLNMAGSADVVWSFVDEARDLVLGPAGGQALVQAARDARLEVVKALLRVGAGAKESREEALREAAKKGHRGCIVALLDAGVYVNAGYNHYSSALYFATANGHAECVKELLLRGAKMDQPTEDILMNVAREGRLDALKVLIELRVNTNASRERALRAAARGGHRGCVVALLDAGVDVDAGDTSKWTALHLAALYGHAECVKELLQRGAKKELKLSDGRTALDIAKQNQKAGCIDILQN